MKKFAILAIVVASLFIAGTALADSYIVTNNFGVRVIEKGASELIGSTTLSPNPDTSSQWYDGQVITVELLGNATLSRNFDYDLAFGGGTGSDYNVVGTKGNDFFTVYVGSDSSTDDTIVFGDMYSPICFNLSATTYNSNDPNNQLVKVSYRDDQSNTYSGDVYVATVKPPAHVISVCTKSEGTYNTNQYYDWDLAEGWNYYDYPYVLQKDGLPEIDMCYSDEGGGQEQEPGTDCGEDSYSDAQACFTIDDPSNVFNDNEYTLTVSTDYPNVGLRHVALYYNDSDPGDTPELYHISGSDNYTLYDKDGDELDPDDLDDDGGWYLVKKIKFNSLDVPSGKLYANIRFAADTCTAHDGDLSVTVAMNRVPCGDGTTATLKVAHINICGDETSPDYHYDGVLPYFTLLNGWWSGLALTNVTDEAQTVTLSIYEADGDMYTCVVTVPANGIVSDVFTATAYHGNAITTSSSDATFGDEKFSIIYNRFGEVYAFALLGDGAQAQGYLAEPYYMEW